MLLLKKIDLLVLAFFTFIILGISCTTVDLYEKTVPVPGHEWHSSFKPSFTFTIKDTIATYQLMLVLRHTEKYNFNNIYVDLHARVPGQDSALHIRQDLRLANDASGWEASGMDDIYEHRKELGSPQTLKAGTYTFTLEQIMREDPLLHVMDVGLRVQKL